MFPIVLIGFAATGISGIVSYNITTFLLNNYYEEKVLKNKNLKKKQDNEELFKQKCRVITKNLIKNDTKKYNSIPRNVKWNKHTKTILIPKKEEYKFLKDDLWYNNNDYNNFSNSPSVSINY